MNMKFVISIFEILKSAAISYGQFFILIGTILDRGKEVTLATLGVLSSEKYAHVKAHFEKAILLFIAAIAELKKGKVAMTKAYAETPEDFKELNSFLIELKKQVPESIAQCFSGMETLIKGIDPEEAKKWTQVPAFIRESGEYMDLVNVGAVEMDADQFIKHIIRGNGADVFGNLVELMRVKEQLFEQGWTSNSWQGDKGPKVQYIFWGTEADGQAMVDRCFKVVEHTGENIADSNIYLWEGVTYEWIGHKAPTEESKV